MNMFDKLKGNKSENEISSNAIEEIETTVEKVNPYLAWETDEKLIELREKYKEAKKIAQGKGDILKRMAGELRVKELNKTNNLPDIARKSIDEIITDVDKKISTESSESIKHRIYLLKKASKESWDNDSNYKQAAINYLSYILPYIEELDKKVLEYFREIQREERRHSIEEAALKSQLNSERRLIVSYVGVHGMNASIYGGDSYAELMGKDIPKAKYLVELEIDKLTNDLNESPPDAELMSLNDKILHELMANGGVIKTIH